MVTITTSVSGKTVTYTLSGTAYSVVWQFSDASTALGKIASHTYSDYGTYTALCTWKDASQNEKGQNVSVTINDPNKNSKHDIGSDVFGNRPFYIPPDCDGNIKITAQIEELDQSKVYTTANYSSQVSSYVVYNNVPVPASGSVDLEVDPTNLDEAYVSDYNLDNLFKIPAFYDYGNVVVTYTVGSTDNTDDLFDITWGAQMSFASSTPSWYEGNYSYDSYVMGHLIKGVNSEVSYPTATICTTMIQQFTVDTWNGMPPLVLGWYTEQSTAYATSYAVHRAMLTCPKFKFTATNNLASNCYLNNVKVEFIWNYTTNGTLMDLRSEGDKKKQYAQIYTLPKGSEQTRLSGLDYPLFGVVSGYKVGTSSRIAEIVKVYGFYDKWYSSESVYFPSCVQLYPVDGTDGPDFPACVWKSNRIVKETDFERMAYKGTDPSSDYLKVITPELIAADEYYRTINVAVIDNKLDNDTSAEFQITTSVNSDIMDTITNDELKNSVETVNYFNVSKPFDNSVTISRSEIDPIFYERLYYTYKDSTVLQSYLDESLNYVEFSINSYATYVPIYNGGNVQFSDTLTHAADGVRSSDVFVFSNTKANIINVKNPAKHKYKVKFYVDYNVYKDIYVVKSEDIAW